MGAQLTLASTPEVSGGMALFLEGENSTRAGAKYEHALQPELLDPVG
jgi:hypothetical protein